MVTIITPCFNGSNYVKECIESVLAQEHSQWELIIVNDGSTDNSEEVILSYDDARIKYLKQENKGVSAARNYALECMSGDYFCFLDSDDILPYNSLSTRLQVFQENSDLTFVDGAVIIFDREMNKPSSIWEPKFNGSPLMDLICLTGQSFFGLTWLIKREKGRLYRMKEGLSHGEDLLFYMELARDGGLYAFTTNTVLNYRNTPGSAMKNLEGLEEGYRKIEMEIKNWEEVPGVMRRRFQWKYRKSMFLSYLRRKDLPKCVGIWL